MKNIKNTNQITLPIVQWIFIDMGN